MTIEYDVGIITDVDYQITNKGSEIRLTIKVYNQFGFAHMRFIGESKIRELFDNFNLFHSLQRLLHEEVYMPVSNGTDVAEGISFICPTDNDFNGFVKNSNDIIL